jgi:hypothetical protein
MPPKKRVICDPKQSSLSKFFRWELDENDVDLGIDVEADGAEPVVVDVPKQSFETETVMSKDH